jgi:hypothetical protein
MRFNIHDLPALVGLLAPKYADAALAVDHVVSIADHSAPVPEGHDEHYVPQVGGYVTVKQPTPGATVSTCPHDLAGTGRRLMGRTRPRVASYHRRGGERVRPATFRRCNI